MKHLKTFENFNYIETNEGLKSILSGVMMLLSTMGSAQFDYSYNDPSNINSPNSPINPLNPANPSSPYYYDLDDEDGINELEIKRDAIISELHKVKSNNYKVDLLISEVCKDPKEINLELVKSELKNLIESTDGLSEYDTLINSVIEANDIESYKRCIEMANEMEEEMNLENKLGIALISITCILCLSVIITIIYTR